MPTPFAWIQCANPNCNLRVPATGGHRMDRCPRCHAPASIVATGVAADVERGGRGDDSMHPRLPVELVIDNVRSAFNVGSIVRSADGAAVAALHLCGFTPTPDHPRVAKTALGAEMSVPWRSHPNALHLVEARRQAGAAIWALETTPDALSLWETPLPPVTPDRPLLLIAGNEVTGVDPAILRLADAVVEIPMRWHKQSLNVAVAVGIALTLVGARIPTTIGSCINTGKSHANT